MGKYGFATKRRWRRLFIGQRPGTLKYYPVPSTGLKQRRFR
jgi:hypothetical protein